MFNFILFSEQMNKQMNELQVEINFLYMQALAEIIKNAIKEVK